MSIIDSIRSLISRRESPQEFEQHISSYILDLNAYLAAGVPIDDLLAWSRAEITEEEFLARVRRQLPRQSDLGEMFRSMVQADKKRLPQAEVMLRELDVQLENAAREGREDDAARLRSFRKKLVINISMIQQRLHPAKNYYSHFLEESRFRVIDAASHLKEGRIYWFGEPAHGPWIWVVTSDDELIIANRQSSIIGGYNTKVPHPVLSKGKAVRGAGELYINKGVITEFNAQSGHFFSREDLGQYVTASREAFERAARKLGIWHNPAFVDKLIE